jgi:sensor c-di-GMP phosphodiesterase-like protein
MCCGLLVGIIALIICIYAFRSRESLHKELLDKIDNVKIELIKEIKTTKGN